MDEVERIARLTQAHEPALIQEADDRTLQQQKAEFERGENRRFQIAGGGNRTQECQVYGCNERHRNHCDAARVVCAFPRAQLIKPDRGAYADD